MNSYKFVEGWEVRLTSNKQILVLIQMHKFLTVFLPVWDKGSCDSASSQ